MYRRVKYTDPSEIRIIPIIFTGIFAILFACKKNALLVYEMGVEVFDTSQNDGSGDEVLMS